MPFKSAEKKAAWAKEYGKRPEVVARRKEYGKTYQPVAKRLMHERVARENALRLGRMHMMPCPHCGEPVPLSDNSTFVLKKETVGEQFEVGDYVSNPGREYKTPEAYRRAQLAHYWRNREAILAKAREKRQRAKLIVQK